MLLTCFEVGKNLRMSAGLLTVFFCPRIELCVFGRSFDFFIISSVCFYRIFWEVEVFAVDMIVFWILLRKNFQRCFSRYFMKILSKEMVMPSEKYQNLKKFWGCEGFKNAKLTNLNRCAKFTAFFLTLRRRRFISVQKWS